MTDEKMDRQLRRTQVGLEHSTAMPPPSMAFRTNSLHACLYRCLSGMEMWVSETSKSVHIKVCGHDVCVVVGGPCVYMCGFRDLPQEHISREEPSSLPFPSPSPTSSAHGCLLNSSYGAARSPGATVLDGADSWGKQSGSWLTSAVIR